MPKGEKSNYQGNQIWTDNSWSQPYILTNLTMLKKEKMRKEWYKRRLKKRACQRNEKGERKERKRLRKPIRKRKERKKKETNFGKSSTEGKKKSEEDKT